MCVLKGPLDIACSNLLRMADLVMCLRSDHDLKKRKVDIPEIHSSSFNLLMTLLYGKRHGRNRIGGNISQEYIHDSWKQTNKQKIDSRIYLSCETQSKYGGLNLSLGIQIISIYHTHP